jgi:methylthioribose-1-phosphate isomerase
VLSVDSTFKYFHIGKLMKVGKTSYTTLSIIINFAKKNTKNCFMKINDKEYRTLWMDEEGKVYMIHQNELPYRFRIFQSDNYTSTTSAIRDMIVRGAGAIGVAAGFAMAQAFVEFEKLGKQDVDVEQAKQHIESSRPTARNLFYATNAVFEAGMKGGGMQAMKYAQFLAEQDLQMTKAIGEYGNQLIEDGFRILTHCNAGRLAFVDYGSALSPIYMAHQSKKNVYVFVDETRPRSQGARLTAWELLHEGIPFDIIPDNAAAHFMGRGQVDMVIVGADRIARNGDVANKIGTLEKAICASHFNIPFYVAAPSSTFDLNCPSGNEIPIEERHQDEVLFQTGITKHGNLNQIQVAAPGATALNPAFDVTPAHLIKGIITEYGIIEPNEDNIVKLIAD